MSSPSATTPAFTSMHTELEIGKTYTRSQIRGFVGGNVQEYLPHVAGRVVCGCFDLQRNPDAPTVVLPGPGIGMKRWANAFASQMNFVPIFLKRAPNAWEYVGNYRVKRQSFDENEVSIYARDAGTTRIAISQVLFLEAER